LSDLLFRSVLANANTPEPSTDCEIFPGRNCQRCLDRAQMGKCHHLSFLDRIGLSCTLTESLTALLVTADAASTGLMRNVAVRRIYLYGRLARVWNVHEVVKFISKQNGKSRVKNSREMLAQVLRDIPGFPLVQISDLEADEALGAITVPRQLRAYLPVVAIRPAFLPAFPVARLGCSLRRVAGAICVSQHPHA
jgi:hypothetical protein